MYKKYAVLTVLFLIITMLLAACSSPAPRPQVQQVVQAPQTTQAPQGGTTVVDVPLPGAPGPALGLTGDPAAGAIVAEKCTACHGKDGKGGLPNPGSDAGTIPALNPINPALKGADEKAFATNLDLFIEHGGIPKGSSPARSMIPFGDKKILTPQQIADVIAYIISLNK
jgi:mono/diheme cytochrome c family protein